MIVDTDILIWHLRGYPKAGAFVEKCVSPAISAVTRMELFVGCRSAQEKKLLHGYLQALSFTTLSIDTAISHRACLLIEAYRPAFELNVPDAIIAATAIEHGLTLATGNYRHFKMIKGLDVHRFAIHE
ncbi:MAG: type II toxin-antitoxin system VapC family toxin [Fibrobacterota bacterium]